MELWSPAPALGSDGSFSGHYWGTHRLLSGGADMCFSVTHGNVSSSLKEVPEINAKQHTGLLLSWWPQTGFSVDSSQWYYAACGKEDLFLSELMDSKLYAWFTEARGQGEARHLMGNTDQRHTGQFSERGGRLRWASRAERVALVSFRLNERLINIKLNFMWLSSSPEFICYKRITVISASSRENNTNIQWHLWFPAVRLLPGQFSYWVSVSQEHGF